MKYGYSVFQQEVEEHLFWIAKSNTLKGCVGQGDTLEEAVAELSENEVEWLETAKELEIPIPEESVHVDRQYTGKFALRMSPYVHYRVDCLAKELGISVNHLICDAIALHLNDLSIQAKSSRGKTDSSTFQFSESLSPKSNKVIQIPQTILKEN